MARKIRFWADISLPEFQALKRELSTNGWDVEEVPSGSSLLLIDRCDGKGWVEHKDGYAGLQREYFLVRPLPCPSSAGVLP